MVIDLSVNRVTNLGKASQSNNFQWGELLKLIKEVIHICVVT